MKKLNKKQKEHIKSIFFKGLHIVCYVLSALFIVLLVVVGAQSCQQRNTRGVSAESYSYAGINYNYAYNYNLNSQVTLTSSKRTDLLSAFDLDDGDVYFDYDEDEIIEYEYSLPLNTTCFVNNDFFLEPYSIKYTFKVYDDNDDHLYINLKLLEFGWHGGYITIMYKVNDTYNNYVYQTGYYGDIQSDYTLRDINGINVLYSVNDIDTFTFNKIFNYNAPFGIGLDMPYSPYRPSSMPAYDNYFDYNVGTFVSNGQVFDTIRWNIRNNSGQEFWLWIGGDNGHIISSHDAVGFTWVSIQYINSVTNTTIDVCQRSINIGEYEGAYVTFYNSGSIWQVDEYRTIRVLDGLTNSDRLDLEQFNNNNQYSYSGNVVSGDINNIFTLIASAFTALLPVMGIYLLPGITLGTLLFIPLVAMLVFVIIRIIKK